MSHMKRMHMIQIILKNWSRSIIVFFVIAFLLTCLNYNKSSRAESPDNAKKSSGETNLRATHFLIKEKHLTKDRESGYFTFNWTDYVGHYAGKNARITTDNLELYLVGAKLVFFYHAQVGDYQSSRGLRSIGGEYTPVLAMVNKGDKTLLIVSNYFKPGDGIAEIFPFLTPCGNDLCLGVIYDDDTKKILNNLNAVWGVDVKDKSTLKAEKLKSELVVDSIYYASGGLPIPTRIWTEQPIKGGLFIGDITLDDIRQSNYKGKTFVMIK